MKIIAQTILLFVALVLTGCDRSNSSSSGKPDLSIVIWPSFPSATNSYRHLEHLTDLIQRANALISTNPSALGRNVGRLANDSPLRELLGIPQKESASVSWSGTIDHTFITIRSLKTNQRFGRIAIDVKNGLIDSCYDVEALYPLSEMEWNLRRVVGTREEALRLFGGRSPQSPSLEQQQATKAIVAALFLPSDAKVDISMSAPGGSNMGQGYLRVETVRSNSYPEQVAMVGYGIDDSFFNFLAQFGVARYHYRFGGLALRPAWTNLNTQSFLLDSNGFPYPKK